MIVASARSIIEWLDLRPMPLRAFAAHVRDGGRLLDYRL